LVPLAIDGVAGVTAIEVRVAAVTVRVVMPTTAPLVAEMSVVPTATLLASPREASAFEIVAVADVVDAHVTVPVRSCVVVSVKVPVATNCCLVPLAIDGVAGVTAIETKFAGVTVSVVLPLIPPIAAEMLVLPVVRPLARPFESAAFETVATAAMLDAHVTLSETSWVEASSKKPVAMNCCWVPLAIDGTGGVTAIETRVAAVTVRVVLPLTAPKVAEIREVPAATPVASPNESAAFEIVAVAVVSEAQVTLPEMFCVVASL
jgi:hypothetical protein